MNKLLWFLASCTIGVAFATSSIAWAQTDTTSGNGADSRRHGAFVELAPRADQTITGSHALIMSDPAMPDSSIKLIPDVIELHSGFAEAVDLYTHADPGFRAPYINFYKSRGTRSAPTAVTFTGYELDSIGGINFGGYDGAGYFAGSAAIYTQSDEDWTPTSHGGHLSIYGTGTSGGQTQQIIQFGGKDPNGVDGHNIISLRPLVFFGNQSQYPGIFPSSSPAKLAIRTGDNLGDASLSAGSLIVTTPHTPATAFEACVAGTLAWDANFVYVCVATNTWRRSALAAW